MPKKFSVSTPKYEIFSIYGTYGICLLQNDSNDFLLNCRVSRVYFSKLWAIWGKWALLRMLKMAGNRDVPVPQYLLSVFDILVVMLSLLRINDTD